MALPRAPFKLPTPAPQLYAELRNEYVENLKKLQQFSATQEYTGWLKKINSTAVKPVAYFEETLSTRFEEKAPSSDSIENKIQLLEIANKMVQDLIALKDAALKHSKQSIWLEASLDTWLSTAQLAQHLFDKRTRTDFWTYSITPIQIFSATVQAATKLIAAPGEQTAQTLINHTNALGWYIEGRPASRDREESRLVRGLMGALTFLAGLALCALALFISAALVPTGIGFLPGIPLAFLSGIIMGTGLAEIAEAISPSTITIRIQPPRNREDSALIDSSRNTSKSLYHLAGTLYPSAKIPPAQPEKQHEPVPLFNAYKYA